MKLTEKEQKIARLALDKGAKDGERQAAAGKLIDSLYARGVTVEDILCPRPPRPVPAPRPTPTPTPTPAPRPAPARPTPRPAPAQAAPPPQSRRQKPPVQKHEPRLSRIQITGLLLLCFLVLAILSTHKDPIASRYASSFDTPTVTSSTPILTPTPMPVATPMPTPEKTQERVRASGVFKSTPTRHRQKHNNQ